MGCVGGRGYGDLVNGMTCGECGMYVASAGEFHPYLYCWLFKRGILDPGRFLAEHGFSRAPAPAHESPDQ